MIAGRSGSRRAVLFFVTALFLAGMPFGGPARAASRIGQAGWFAQGRRPEPEEWLEPPVCAGRLEQGTKALPADRERALRGGGVYNMYPEVPAALAEKVPCGYKPFYISHFGRHGARYNVGGYERMYEWLEGSHAAGALTSFGESVRERYVRMYPTVRKREGDLAFKGQAQQDGIALRMYRRYRPVFRRRAARVEAVSSTSGRCIMTMNAFCHRLTMEQPSLPVRMDVGERYNAYMRPSSASNPHYGPSGAIRKSGPAHDAYEADHERLRARFDPDPFVQRLFADPAYADSLCKGDRRALADEFYYLVASTPCIDYEEDFHDIFTPEEWHTLWEADSFQYYANFGPGSYFKGLQWAIADTLLSDFIVKAEEDIAAGDVAARLRFGHDTGLMSLLTLLGAEGFSTPAARAEDAAAVWQNWRFTMSVNLQWIFYRNRRGDILVRILLNEQDLGLPVGEGPCYEWPALRAWCQERLALANHLLQSE